MSRSRNSWLFPAMLTLALFATSTVEAQPYTRPIYNHSSQSVTCPYVCTMTPAVCGPGQSCTVFGYGFSVMTVVGTDPLPQIVWKFTPNPSYATAIYSYVASTSSEDLYNFLSLELLDTGSSISLSTGGVTTIPENGGSFTISATRSGDTSPDPTIVEIDFFGSTATLSEPPSSSDDFSQPGPAIWKTGELMRYVYTMTIPANQSTGTLVVTARNDAVFEPDEAIRFKINGASSATWNPAQLTVFIDDDDAKVTLGTSTATIPETGGSATLTAYVSPANIYEAMVVSLGFSGAATRGTDYSASQTITIPIGASSATTTIAAISDTIDEIDEPIVVDIIGVTNGSEQTASGQQQQTVTILDDDGPTVTLELTGSPFAENGGTATVTARLSAASPQPVTVDLGFGGTATNGVDYTRSATSITVPAGSTTGSITLTGSDDLIDEADETVVVDIISVTNGFESPTPQQVTAVVADDDAAPMVTLSVSATSFAENAGAVTVTATLSSASSLPVTINLAADGTATAIDDYIVSSATISIPAGDTTGTVTITGVDDALDEPDETVIIDIESATNATEDGTQQVTATILDDDASPEVTLALAPNNIDEAGGASTITASLGATSGFNVTVHLAFSGSATNLDDYTRSSETITIPSGSLSATAALTAVDDATDEADETVIVDISSVTNATESGTQQVTATIVDDDDPPLVTLSLSGSPFAENGGSATVTATLSAVSSLPVTVHLLFSGSADNATDYTRSAESIAIAAGSLSGTIVLSGIDDLLDEVEETVVVDIASVVNGTEDSSQQVTAVIADDDDPPAVTLTLTGTPLAEGSGTATVTATLDQVSALPVTVALAFSGTATPTADYTRSADSIVIAAGSLDGSVTITAVDDAVDEPDETIVIEMAGVTNAIEGAVRQVSAVIEDDEATPTVSLYETGSPLAENGGGMAHVTAVLSGLSSAPVTIELTFSGTAVRMTDYVAPASIVIPAGDPTGTISIIPVDDPADEPDETVIIDIESVTGAIEAGTQQVTIVIADDDATPEVTLSLSGSPMAESAGFATITATLSGISGLPVTVDLAFGGTAAAPDDYVTAGAPIVIPAGSLTGDATLTVVDDALDETDETIVIDIATVTNGIESGTQQVVATIIDDDAAPGVTLSLTGSPIAENGGIATVSATLDAVSALPVTVDLTLSGTAVAPDDYTAASSVVIPPGALTGTATITANDDLLDETDETIVIDIAAVTNGIESGIQQVIATIIDDDAAPGVTLSLTGSPLAENGGIATVSATLDAVSALPVTVDLTLGGTAVAPDDYTAASAIVIPPGALTGTTTITANDDLLDETDETIVIDIAAVTNGIESGTQQVVATIIDDDAAPGVTLSLTGSPLAEDGGIATASATLDAVSALPVTVDLTLSGTATAPDDYSASTTSIVILPGALTGTATITANDDLLDETDETIVIEIAAVTNGVENGTQQVVATIIDDDAAPGVTLALTGSPIAENGGVATLMATIDAASSLPITVDLILTGTASAPDDYTASATAITIAPGSLSGIATLTANDDALDEVDETIVIDIATVANGVEISVQQVTATILDDDAAPAVTLTLTGSPIAENGGVATVTATIDAVSSLPVTVDLALTGTATAPDDYTASATSITIAPGALTGTATVTAIDDLLDESDETVVVDLVAVTNAVEAVPQQVTITIADDDDPSAVDLTLAGSPVAENGGVATVTATLVAVSGHDITVDLAFTGTATDPDDYTASAASITVPAGATSGSIAITAADDTLSEGDETVVIAIATVTNGTPGSAAEVTATIADDDAEPMVTLTLTGSPIAENGGIATVTATLSEASGRDVTVALTFTGTATRPDDYTASATTITIAAGTLTGNLVLTAVNDAISDPDETIIIDVASITNAGEDGTQQVTATIEDDDAARLAFVQQPTDSVAGVPIAPAVTVEILDDSGRRVSSTAAVTLAIEVNPGGATLGGTPTVAAVDGIAAFPDLTLDQPGTAYTLSAGGAGLTTASSAPFDVAPEPVTSVTMPTLTGTGAATIGFIGGGPRCTLTDAEMLPPPPGSGAIPPTAPPGLFFPHGLFRFSIENCDPGSAITFTVTYPAALPADAQYWKYGPPAASAPPVWFELPAVISGNTVTFTVVDGGAGDDDGVANGIIRDPSGAAAAVTDVPLLAEWMLWLLALLLAGAGLVRMRA